MIAGVPFAVWLIRLSEADERKRAEVAAAAERSRDAEDARTRRHAILSVIDNQLRRALKEVCGDRAGPPRELVLPYLPVEGWAAFSASGELQWINDAGLIAKIANA